MPNVKTKPIRRPGAGPWLRARRWTFPSNLISAWLFWTLTCALAVTAGIGVAYLGGPDSGTALETSAPVRSSGVSDAPPTEDDRVVEYSAEPDHEGDNDEPAAGGGGLAEFEGTAVQVLNASSDDGVVASLAARLEEEGFRIQVVEPAARIYQRTTVFWTPNDGRAAAEALADRFGWRTGPKPSTLTDAIPVHVVVGEDFAS